MPVSEISESENPGFLKFWIFTITGGYTIKKSGYRVYNPLPFSGQCLQRTGCRVRAAENRVGTGYEEAWIQRPHLHRTTEMIRY